jgi:hypothetical protein
MNGWLKDGSWARWHYVDGDALLCGRVPAELPHRRFKKVATSQRCPECDVERAKVALVPGPESAKILAFLDRSKGPPMLGI